MIEIHLHIFHIMDLYFHIWEYKYTYSQMVCVRAFFLLDSVEGQHNFYFQN